jgi:hypothetical protein
MPKPVDKPLDFDALSEIICDRYQYIGNLIFDGKEVFRDWTKKELKLLDTYAKIIDLLDKAAKVENKIRLLSEE